LQTLKKDTSIIICPADKGKAVVIEDRDAYLRKMQDKIDERDHQLAKGSEKTLLNLTEFGERRQFMVMAPVMANLHLLIKVHKNNLPGRAVVSQVHDPTYNICNFEAFE